MDLTLGGEFIAAGSAQAQVRLGAPAVGFAQAPIDEPGKQVPDVLVFGGGRICGGHKDFESLKMSAALIPPKAGND
jgi:hypothetical protein